MQILCASLATAAGFLAFVPTAFSGVAELGLIAGGGMLIAFICTLTFLPAAITLFNPSDEAAEVGFSWARPLDPWIQTNHRWLLAVFRRPGGPGPRGLAAADVRFRSVAYQEPDRPRRCARCAT